MAWKYRFDFVEDEDGEFIAEVISAPAGPLLAAGPELRDAINGLNGLIDDMQTAVVDYLQPDGISADELIGKLIYLLDGPEQRAAQGAARAALALCEGDSE